MLGFKILRIIYSRICNVYVASIIEFGIQESFLI